MQNANITASIPEPGHEAHTKCDTCQQDRQKCVRASPDSKCERCIKYDYACTSEVGGITESVEPKRRKLNKMSCQFCRRDKQKCLPLERSWPSRKCDRCIEKGLDCSEPQAARKPLVANLVDESDDSGDDAVTSMKTVQIAVEPNPPDPISQWYSSNDGPWIPTKQAPDLFARPQQPLPRHLNAKIDGTWRQGGPSSDSGYGTVRSSSPRQSVFSTDVHEHEPFTGFGELPMHAVFDRPKLICPTCHKPVKTQSELKKHDLRHKKPFLCKIPGCSRTEGFSTTNDLERHMKSMKHALTPLPEKTFRCIIPGCKSKDKSWPRLDNFRSHLKRVHSNQLGTDEDFENIVRQAEFSTDQQDKEKLSPAASSPQMQSTQQHPRMQGLRQGYLSPGNGLYLADQSSLQSMEQTSVPQPGAQDWASQQPPESGSSQPTSIPSTEREIINPLEQEYVPRRALRTGITGKISTAGWTPALNNLAKTNQILRRNQYKYRPIADHEIRLLLLQPGHWNDIIQCSLVPTSLLGQQTPYEALSYYRGVDKPLFEIRILSLKSKNGKRSLRDLMREKYFISLNLHLALRYLRDVKRPIYLWVGELCINKEDLQEQSSNILKRSKIFSRASNVCVWLGESDSSSSKTIEFIPQILDLSLLDNLVEDASRIPAWLAFIETMARPWFSRLWSIQEMAFSTNATVHFGSDVIHWADFADAVALFHFNTDKINQLLRKSPHSSDKKHIFKAKTYFATTVVDASRDLVRYSYDNESAEMVYTLDEILPKFTRFKTTDPRDAIFALLPLAKDALLTLISTLSGLTLINYQQDVSKIYLEIVMYSMSSSKSLDLICRRWAPLTDTPQWQEFVAKSVLPSWIPSFSDSQGTNDNAFCCTKGYDFVGLPGQKVYNASGSASHAIRIVRQSSSLSVLGFRLGTIDRHLSRITDGIIWKHTFQMAGLRQYSQDISTVPEKLWRTLVADRDPNGSSPPSWYHRACLYSLAHASTISNGDLDTSLLLRCPGSSSEKEFLERVQAVTWNRSFFTIAPKDRFGIGPAELKEHDQVCILYGCSVPVVLREVASSDGVRNFKVIGECFVYGMMEGEALSERVGEDETFILV